jgi:hypothetical protein
MSGYVVDASVAVKWLVTENFSEQAARLLDEELTLIAPELLFAQAGNALWAMCRRGIITKPSKSALNATTKQQKMQCHDTAFSFSRRLRRPHERNDHSHHGKDDRRQCHHGGPTRRAPKHAGHKAADAAADVEAAYV